MTQKRRYLGLFLLLGLIATQTACSWIFVKPPSDAEQNWLDTRPRPVRLPAVEGRTCTSSKVAPILDTVFGAFQVARTGYALQASESDYVGAKFNRGTDIALGVALTGVFFLSAYYGYSHTAECTEVTEAIEWRNVPTVRTAPAPVRAPAPKPVIVPEPTDLQSRLKRAQQRQRDAETDTVAPPSPSTDQAVEASP